jgi:hypothetical protein
LSEGAQTQFGKLGILSLPTLTALSFLHQPVSMISTATTIGTNA